MANSRVIRFIKRPMTYAATLVLVGSLLQAAPASSLTFNTRPEVEDEASVPGEDIAGALDALSVEDTATDVAPAEPLESDWPTSDAGETGLTDPGTDLQVVDDLITVAQVSDDVQEAWSEEVAEDYADASSSSPEGEEEPQQEESTSTESEEDPGTEQAQPEERGGPETEADSEPEAESTTEPAPGEAEEAEPAVSSVESVQVEVLDRSAAEEAGIEGLLLRVTRTDEEDGVGPVDLTVDYSDFANAYGGDYGGRLDLVEVDTCLLDDSVECQDRAPHTFTTDNDTDAQTLTGTVPALGGEGMLLAAAAEEDSSRGDYQATDLSATSSWDVGLQTGSFSWSYPVDTPPVAGDLTPGIELGYSSASVDGRVSSSNNQTSWIGEGFNYNPGFIERKYVPCADSQPDSAKTGDLCWSRHNATFSLNGRSGEMFLDEDGTWRMRHDDASRIERLTGTTNGDNDGEYWRITTTDGTQYYFGMNRLPGYGSGDAETNSAWTVPVFGRNSGQPCNGSSFANSWCQQAWRWNLDYVVDAHGNVMTYQYTKERNYYGRNGQANSPTVYDRGGYLRRINYGLRSDDVYATAPARVNFAVSERCIPTDGFDCAEDKFTSGNASHWPDAPFDRHCAQGQNCTNKLSPTFWTRKKLDSITTQVHDGSAYDNVDSWELEHVYPANGDGTAPDLWLQSIAHTGHVGDTASMPTLEFGGTQFENRVDTQDDGFAPMLKWRITKILTESGSQTDISYAGGECDTEDFPDPHTNGTRCFPVVNSTADGKGEYTDWFHKYVVTQVSENDLVTEQPDLITTYEYLGDAAWRYQDADGFVRDERRTWSDWRGYAHVRVIEGQDNATQSATEHRFFRGMHGDRLPNGTRTATVTDSAGGEHTDLNQYNGFTLEEATLNGPGGDVVDKTISLPWSRVTGERTYSWGTIESRMTGMASSTQYTAVGNGWMRSRESAEYDSLGRITQTHDHGDLDDADDDQCTRYTYADNTGLRILDTVARTEKVAVGCGTTPTYPDDVISDERSLFDGGGFGDAPTVGLETSSQRVMEYDGSTPTYQVVQEREHDAYGRTVSETDALGNVTETDYTTTVPGGAPATVTTTNPLGHTTTEHFDPARGLPVAEIDANGNRSDMTYDPLGRLTAVWTPDLKKSDDDPAMRFEYHVRNDAPTVVATHTRNNEGGYSSTYQIYDGLLRERQRQEPGVGGRRLITDTFYDSRGLKVKERHAYTNDEAPTQDVFMPGDNDDHIPRYTQTVYDGAERPTEVLTMSNGRELWRTSSEDRGDRQLVTPAPGAIPTTTIKNARGQTIEVRQHQGDTPEADYTALTYTHTPSGQVETVTDEAGNVWRNHYDLRGRKVRTDEPDRGTTTFVYDSADRMVARTDARDETVVYAYDELGRKTEQREGGVNGPLLASWTFDSVAKGELTRATRHADGLQYSTSIAAYDAMGRPLATTISIPSAPEYGALSGSYRFRSTYNADGTIETETLPAVGGLPREFVRYTYNELGLPVSVAGSLEGVETLDYVHETSYSSRGQIMQRWHHRNDGSHQAKSTWSARTYDPGTQRLLSARVSHEIGHGTLVDQAYSYDAAGNVLSIRDEPTAQGLLPDVQCFAYDDMRRLTNEWTTAASGDQACDTTPSQEAMGGAAPYWNSYTYDDLGNRLTETRHGFVDGSDVERTYQRPGAGEERPHAVTQVDSNGAGGTATYTYDEAGNMASRQDGNRTQTLEWDAEGQLAAIHEGQNTSEFVYDAEGERLIRDDGGVVTLFLPGMEIKYDKEDLVSQSTRLYEHAGEVVASRSNDGRVHWILSDHHKTGQLAIDSLTGETIRRRFTAFGGDRGSVGGAWPNSRGFVGGVIDEQVGLTRLGARSYAPELGSFISPDPVVDFSDPEQMHGYSYSNNNPVSFTDPDGLFLRKAFSQARRWAAYQARQAAIRAYQARLAAIRAYRIRQAAIRAARIRAAQIRAAKIRAAQIRAAKIAAAKRAAAARAAAARKAAAVKAARERAARVAAEKRREAARRQAQRQQAQNRESAKASMSRSNRGTVEYHRVSTGLGGSDFREPTDDPSGSASGPVDCMEVACHWDGKPVAPPPSNWQMCMSESSVAFGVGIGTMTAVGGFFGGFVGGIGAIPGMSGGAILGATGALGWSIGNCAAIWFPPPWQD